MDINTDITFGKLPEKNHTYQSMTEEEKTVCWPAMQDIIDAAAGIKRSKQDREVLGIKDTKLDIYREQFLNAISIIELLDKMSKARQDELVEKIKIRDRSEVEKNE